MFLCFHLGFLNSKSFGLDPKKVGVMHTMNMSIPLGDSVVSVHDDD